VVDEDQQQQDHSAPEGKDDDVHDRELPDHVGDVGYSEGAEDVAHED